MRPKHLLFLAVAAVVLFPSSAMAGEYWTLAGFGVISSAFEKIALWTSSRVYLVFASFVFVVGWLFGAYHFVRDWKKLGVVVIGWSLFMGGVLVKTDVQIYDPILNRNHTQGGVPVLVDLIAGSLNAVEQEILEQINTSADPLSFNQSADGVGFSKLLDASMNIPTAHDADMETTLATYVENCVGFALRPGGPITMQEILNDNTDLLDVLAKASNYAIFTTLYVPPAGMTTCGDAWPVINAHYRNPANWDRMMKGVCGNTVYSVVAPYFGGQDGSSAELQQCREQIAQWGSFATGVPVDDVGMVRQIYLADQILRTMKGMNVDGVADYGYITSAAGGYEFSNRWAPLLRNWIAASSLMVIPWLLVFLPSPNLMKALQWSVGLLLYPVVWTIMDAITHNEIVEMSNGLYEMVRYGKLGINALTLMPDISVMMLGVVYKAQTVNAMFAGALVTFFVQTGGHASALMAQQFSRDVREGGHLQGDMLSPSGAAGRIEGARQGYGNIMNAARHSADDLLSESGHKAMVPTDAHVKVRDNLYNGDTSAMTKTASDAAALQTGAGQHSAEQFIDHSGGLAPAMGKKAHAGAVREVEGAAAAAPQTLEDADLIGLYGGHRDLGMVKGAGKTPKEVAANSEGVSRLKTHQAVADKERAEVLGGMLGRDLDGMADFYANPVLTAADAAALEQSGFGKAGRLSEGMKADPNSFMYNPDSGEPIMFAMSGMAAGDQLKSWADYARSQGKSYAADEMQKAYDAGLPMAIHASIGQGGEAVYLDAKNTASSTVADMGERKSGISLAPDSFNVDSGAAFQAAVKGGAGLADIASYLTAKELSAEERHSRVLNLSGALASGASNWVSEAVRASSEQSMGVSGSAGVDGGLKVFGTGVDMHGGANVSKGWSSGSTINRNELAAQYRTTIEETLARTEGRGDKVRADAVGIAIHDLTVKKLEQGEAITLDEKGGIKDLIQDAKKLL